MNGKHKYLLMLGHLFTDINQGALPAIIPFLMMEHQLNYTAAASLVLAANLVSSFIQPLIGFLGDKTSRPWLMSLGILLAGGGIALLGFCPTYLTCCIAVSISGMGVALFHPEGGKIAHYAAGDKKGTGMSIFVVGGNLGFAIGPIITSLILVTWGLNGTIVLFIPAFIMATVLLSFQRKLSQLSSVRDEQAEICTVGTSKDNWTSFSKISSIVFCRSIILYSLTTFIPLFFIDTFSITKSAANLNLTIYSLMGIVATLLGGRLADQLGLRSLIKFSFTILVPLLFVLFNTDSQIAATLFILPISFAMNCSYSPLIALGQSYMTNHIGLASGVLLGLSVSIGGIFAPIIGWIGDHFGLMIAMYVILSFAVLGFLLTFILPKEKAVIQKEST